MRKPSARCARSVPPTVSCVPAARELVSGGPLPRQVADFFYLTPCSPRGGICPYGACRGWPWVCRTRASRRIIPAHRQDGISGILVFPACWSTSAGRVFRDFGLPGVLPFPGQDHFGRFWHWRARKFPGQDHFGRFWHWPGRPVPSFPRPGGQRQGPWAAPSSPGALSAAGPLRCRGPAVPCEPTCN